MAVGPVIQLNLSQKVVLEGKGGGATDVALSSLKEERDNSKFPQKLIG